MLRMALFAFIGLFLVAAGNASGQRRLEWNCPAMVAQIPAAQVWWGRFSGGREETMGERDGIVPKTTEACFRTRQECERWLYDLKSEYQYDPRWNQCRLGYAPGAPIPRL
jgi:hypothetical protein